MKKFYLFIMSAMMVSLGASAQSQAPVGNQPTKRQQLIERFGQSTANATSFNPVGDVAVPNGVASRLSQKAEAALTVIEDTPEGALASKDFRSGICLYTSRYYGLRKTNYSYTVGQIVEATDGTLYLKDPSFYYAPGTWIKLDKVSDGRYVAKFPQLIYMSSTGTGSYVNRLVGTLDSTNAVTYVPDTTSADAINAYFTYKDGVLAMEDSLTDSSLKNYPKAIIGVTDATGKWQGYGDAAIVMRPNNEEQAKLPAGATPQYYTLENSVFSTSSGKSTVNSAVIKVAFDGNDVYVNNPYTNDSTSWIKGTIDGDKATFKSQYIGPDYDDGYHVWAKPGLYEAGLDSFYLQYGYTVYTLNYSLADELTLAYDATAKTLKAAPGATLILNSLPSATLYYLATYDSLQLTPFAEVAAVPVDPAITNFQEYNGRYGYIAFRIPNADAQGNTLLSDKLYYNMYVDNPTTPYVFEKQLYTKLTSDQLVDVPYSYNDQNDIIINSGYRVIYFYFDTSNVDSVGIQSIYRGAGEEHRSNIVWVHTARYTGIETVATNGKAVSSVSYYDISGRRVAEPRQPGLYIKETTFADGSKRGVKVMRR